VVSGILRQGSGEDEAWGVFIVQRLLKEKMYEPEASDIPGFERGLRQGADSALAKGTQVRVPVTATIVRAGNAKAIRAVYDVDGIPDDAPFARVSQQHHVSYYIPLEGKG